MSTFAANLPDLLEPWVTRIFHNEYDQIPELYPELFNVETSTKAFEDTFAVSGIGTFTLKPEGHAIGYDDPVQSGRKRTVHQTFALGFRCTMEMMDDDQHGIIAKMPADLARSARDHRDTLAFSLYNDAFTGTTYTGIPEGDGTRRSLVSTSHVALKSGSTQSNALSPGVALSVAGIEAATIAFELTQDDSDRQIRITPKVLLIHPNERFNAARYLESTEEPDTNNNAINPINRLGLRVVRSPYLTDVDAWFLQAEKSQHTLTWYDRMKLAFSRNKDAATKDSLWDAMYRASVTFNVWRGVVGSAP